MNVAELRAKLREKMAALTAARTKAFGAEGTAEDKAALRALIDEVKGIEKSLDDALDIEALEAKHSLPAGGAATGTQGSDPAPLVYAEPVEKMSFGRKLALAGAATMKAGGRGGDPIKVLNDEGYGNFVKALETDLRRSNAARGKAVNTLVSSEGGVLVPTPLNGSLIELLRVESTFLAANPTRVTLVNGQFNQPRGATGATASYVAQGGLKPVSTPTFDAINMLAKKLAGIVAITNEAKKWTVGNLADYLEMDLKAAISQTMDLNAYLGTGSGASPTGILNKSGITTVTPTFVSATAPTLAELDKMATQFVLALTTQNIFYSNRWRWIMSYRTAMYIADMRDGNGNKAFPEMDIARNGGPTFKQIPVIVTGQVPTNGGAGTNETTIALVNFADVLYGEESDVVVKWSDSATLDVNGAGQLVHLFQQNMSAVLAESEHDFGLRRAKSVVKATAIKF